MSETLHLGSGRSLVAPTLFGQLDPQLRTELIGNAPLRQFADGALIQQRGDTPSGFWLIKEGRVTVGQFLADGTFRALAVLGSGDSYGELALFSGRRRVVDALARGPADLLWIDGARFEAALGHSPQSMRRLLGALAEELQEMLDVVAGLRRGSASRRIAAMLVNLAGTGPVPIRVAIGQEELGELAGVTRATVNKVLAVLEAKAILQRGYGVLEIADLGRLRIESGK